MQWKESSSESSWKNPETGNWPAVCIRIIDVGTHEAEYEGRKKQLRKSMIVWELPGQLDDEGKPMVISNTYTASLGDKAKLRAHLESWRGRPFTPEELQGFDAKNILRKPCLLNLIEVQRQKGPKVVVTSVSAIPKGMPAPPAPVNDSYLYSIDEHDPAVWDKLSDGIKAWIGRSIEHQSGAVSAPQSQPAAPSYSADEIPF